MHQVAVSLHVSSFRTGHHDKTPTTSILLSAQNLLRVSCPSPPPEGNGQGARREDAASQIYLRNGGW